jgi:hypothetical protein
MFHALPPSGVLPVMFEPKLPLLWGETWTQPDHLRDHAMAFARRIGCGVIANSVYAGV